MIFCSIMNQEDLMTNTAKSSRHILMFLIILVSATVKASEDDCQRGTKLLFRCQAHHVTQWPASKNEMDRNLGEILVQIYQNILVCQGQIRSYAQLFFRHPKGTEKSPLFDARVERSNKIREAIFKPLDDSSVRIWTADPNEYEWNATIEHQDRHTGRFQLVAHCSW